MKKLNSIVYTVMFLLTMCFLFMSGIQRKFKIFKIKPLSGAIEIPQIKKANFENYYNFTFQKSVEKNLEAVFGFKEPLIRLYHQYLWDFYNNYHSTEDLIGKDNWIFPKWHLNVPKYSPELTEKFDKQALYLYLLSNILKEYNTQLLICFVPSKFEIYREYANKDLGDYNNFNAIDYFCSKFDESGVNYINFTQMLYAMKDTAVFNPYSQTGAHWSAIASVYAADSIFKRFESLSGINMPKLKIGTPYLDKTRGQDNDLELLLNLYRPMSQQINYYANVDLITDSTTIYPKMITIGDSHFGNIVDNVPLDRLFSSHPYWYYANSIFFDKKHEYVKQVDIAEEFISSDYVLLLYNAYQTYNIHSDVLLRGITSLCFDDEEIDKGVEFFSQLDTIEIPAHRNKNNAIIYDRFYNVDGTHKIITLSEEDNIAYIMRKMSNSEEWMSSLKKKAKTKNKTLEEVMYEDAIWVIQQEENKKE